jgi:hypothetical protein
VTGEPDVAHHIEAYAELLVGAASPQVSDSLGRSTPDYCISLIVSGFVFLAKADVTSAAQELNPIVAGMSASDAAKIVCTPVLGLAPLMWVILVRGRTAFDRTVSRWPISRPI